MKKFLARQDFLVNPEGLLKRGKGVQIRGGLAKIAEIRGFWA